MEQPSVVVRDSAGVRIVESSVPIWHPDSAWSVGLEPVHEIQSDELYRVRGAYRIQNGQIVVANGGSLELLIFDSAGKLTGRIGGEGSGPGEFRDLSRVRRTANDTIVVADLLNARITVIDPAGEVTRIARLPTLPDGSAALLEHVYGDGSILATPIGGPPAGQGLTRRRRVLWRVPADSEESKLVADIPELEMFFFSHMPRPIAWRQPFFGNNAYYTVGQDDLFWGATNDFQIHRVDESGRLSAVYRLAVATRTFGAAEVSTLIDQSVEAHRNEQARPALRIVLNELPSSGSVPEWGWPDYRLPLGAALLLDADKNLWVAEYHLPADTRNSRTVIGPDGSWLGSVELPQKLAVTQIGRDFIVGIWRDENDVESICVYQLMK